MRGQYLRHIGVATELDLSVQVSFSVQRALPVQRQRAVRRCKAHEESEGRVMQRDEIKRRSLRLLDYLAALALELSQKPRRRLSEYDGPLLRAGDVPEHPGVRLGTSSTCDTWLQVEKVEQPQPPVVPVELDQLLDARHDLDEPPQLLEAVDEHEDADSIRRVYEQWVARVWSPWAVTARSACAARELYQQLYDMRLRVQRDTATHEFVWGFGVLSWATPGAVVEHPLLLSRALIEMDTDSGMLSVIPDEPIALETEPLQGLGLPGLDELNGLRDRVRSSPPDPWAPDGLREVYAQAVAPLGLDAQVVEGPGLPRPERRPVLVSSWIGFIRPRPALHQRFYQELRQSLDEQDVLPEALAAVVSDSRELAAATSGSGRSAGSSAWNAPVRSLLMPLPTNDEQERIARQLDQSCGVTVQGPPGTGKSHTIANLVSHLVAHGQRVLVTAHNEQALSVLRDKIPVELRDLAISVLGSTQVAQGELRSSVQAIMDAVSDLDPDAESVQLEELAAELDSTRTRQRSLELQLLDLLRDEAAEFPLADGPAKATEVAAWLAEHEAEWGRIPDALEPGHDLPVTSEELTELYQLLTGISLVDAEAARLSLPSAGTLPSGADLAGQFRALDSMRDDIADLEAQGMTIHALDSLSVDDAICLLATEVQEAAVTLAALEAPWLRALAQQVRGSASLAGFWTEQIAELTASSARVIELRRQTFGRSVALPDGDPRAYEKLLRELGDRFAAGKGVPRFGHGDLRALHQCLRIDEFEVRTVADVEIAIAALHERTARRAAAYRYREFVQQLNAPELDPGDPAFLPTLEAQTSMLQQLLAWEFAKADRLVTTLRPVFPALPQRPTSTQLNEVAELVRAGQIRVKERRAQARLWRHGQEIASGQQQREASPLWSELCTAFDRRDTAAWDRALAEAGRLAVLRPRLDRRDALLGRVRAVAPRWAELLLNSAGDREVSGDPAVLASLWGWRQAQTWLAGLHARGDVTTLQAQITAAAADARRLVLEIASRGARLGVQRNLREDQRRALIGWLGALARITKTGIYKGRWEAEARAQMPAAMGAVPVWIMPIYRVMQSFDPRRTDLFDVVIVDESSQCDVLSLGVLSLGRKVVVVGDDKQISPSAVGVQQDRIFQLIEEHLPDLPQRALLDVQASLYDVASRAFPNVVLLREHFRCVPDIIGFSNRYYDGKIMPLREAAELGIGPAIRPVLVPDGVRPTDGRNRDLNEPEARALVEQIATCCADPAYAGMTFGVVTFLGAGQPRLIERLLFERLGAEVERRKLRVGDPYQFQGDERDVIFISFVADNLNRFAATKKNDQQRINVAASRARTQLWLFHSIDPGILHPDDVRGHLLHYAYGIDTVEAELADLEQRCDSDFERAVLRELLTRGYRVRPQHKVGRFRIDLVVEGESGRLAIECDGDRFHPLEQLEIDLRRQRVLERQGWTFWRVRGSGFYRNPVAALAPLWDRLDELGVHPRTVVNAIADVSQDAAPQHSDADPMPSTPPVPEFSPSNAGSVLVSKSIDDNGAVGYPVWCGDQLLVAYADVEPNVVAVPQTVAVAPLHESISAKSCGVAIESATHRRAAPARLSLVKGTTPAATPAPSETVVAEVEASRSFDETDPKLVVVETVVPDGYRSVAWLREPEAAGVLKALQLRRDIEVPALNGNIPSLVRYFTPESVQARKYHARTLVVRQRKTGDRWVGWIREYEARAVLQAVARETDVEVRNETGKHIGLIRYYPPGSEVAKKYRSTTRLLRRLGGGRTG